MSGQLKIHEALKAALFRKVARIAQMQKEIDEMGYTGFVTPFELNLLESQGFLLDFDSGLVTDTRTPTLPADAVQWNSATPAEVTT